MSTTSSRRNDRSNSSGNNNDYISGGGGGGGGGGGEVDNTLDQMGIEVIDNGNQEYKYNDNDNDNTLMGADNNDDNHNDNDNTSTSQDTLLTHFERSQSSLHTPQNIINSIHIPSLEDSQRHSDQMIKIAMVIFFYFFISISLIARSLAICFSLLLTYLILKTKTSFKASMACIVVFFGFVLGVMGEVNFSWLGVTFGVLSSLFVALYSIYVKRVLPACDQNEWKLSIYNTAISIVLILPLSIVSGEFQTIWMEPIIYTGQFWLMMTIAGAMGYLISIAVFMQIKHTSPLTNSISATLKSCLQTILAVWVWGNEISFTNAIGIVLVIFGSFYYSFVRYQEMKK
ncbi:GDP-fucose transporter [Cavenderia fasciculata]|uniref:GDP-fucose transporter n=1 Tax=Cavenderia fasciculata TaxID=261658 RepID=F4PRQ6_CACFS|nr:GDP-fucose transporter [Cavenderia fasciculata]EGG20555.1 GDP-fucose transporter [Cavenderia fasciculata]|eukprot:XP_004358405.1 GDP-fucose transporter [Cavenderia fasciculata]